MKYLRLLLLTNSNS